MKQRSGKYVLVIALVLQVLTTAAQTEQEYIDVPSTPFLEEIIARKESVRSLYNATLPFGVMYPPSSELRGQMLLKTPRHCYIYIINTGRLYRLESRHDTILRFNRIDHTRAMYYNVGAYLFTSGEDIYSYGGYGFWKSSGNLRKFNFKDKEWDIVPVSKEIMAQFNPVKVVWYNPGSSYLYVPFQRIVNEGIQGGGEFGKLVPEAYRLNLHSFAWEKLGRVSNAFLALFTDFRKEEPYLQDDIGQIIFKNNMVYWVDYERNRVLTLENVQLRQSIDRLTTLDNRRRYLKNNTVYAYNPQTHSYDSLKLELRYFTGKGFPIWEKTYPDYLIWGLPALSLLILAAGVRYKRRTHRILPVPVSRKVPAVPVALDFNEMEKSLLQLLLDKSLQGDTATIDEINYVLGLKDKNTGIQKKVRRDFINGINQKFELASRHNGVLIQYTRNHSDKRSFEYYIDAQYHQMLKDLL